VLARIDRERSWDLFVSALMSDIADIQGGTTPEGIHLGAMAGTVDLVQRGYTGLEIRGDHLRLDPAIPPELGRLDCHIRYRRRWIDLSVTPTAVRINLQDGAQKAPLTIEVGHTEYTVAPGEAQTISLE
jgi:alpha,alpha-trehalase